MTYTTTAAAQLAGVTTTTIRTWCRMGAVRASKVARRWVIEANSLAYRISLSTRRTRRATTLDLHHNDIRKIATWVKRGSMRLVFRAELSHGGPDGMGGIGTRLLEAGLLQRHPEYYVELTDLGHQVGTDVTNAMDNGVDRATATDDALKKAGLR